jgi:hypothetical protein
LRLNYGLCGKMDGARCLERVSELVIYLQCCEAEDEMLHQPERDSQYDILLYATSRWIADIRDVALVG